MSNLAIFNGQKVRTKLFSKQTYFNNTDIESVSEIIKSQILSGYRGNYGAAFNGAAHVQKLEFEFASMMKVNHAIAVNSCTSGLQVACGAIGLAPGDECIVSPWSMICSATAPLLYNAIPVFADIESEYYCLDPKSIKERITRQTKAIIVVSLFGIPYDHRLINRIAKQNNLFVIEDAAQAIGSYYTHENVITNPASKAIQYAGTFGDLGVFSFTQGKHLTAGEGGMIVTNDDELAMRCKLIRNHADAVIHDMSPMNKIKFNSCNLSNNMLGFNMRMTEIQAALLYNMITDEDKEGKKQKRRLDEFVEMRRDNAEYLYDGICSQIPAIRRGEVRDGCTHSYYCQSFHWDKDKADGLHRDKFINAVKAELVPDEGREMEGVLLGNGYIHPLNLFPIFQERKLYGGTGFPFSLNNNRQYCTDLAKNYSTESIPNTMFLQNEDLFLSLHHRTNLSIDDREDIIEAFLKVYKYRSELL